MNSNRIQTVLELAVSTINLALLYRNEWKDGAGCEMAARREMVTVFSHILLLASVTFLQRETNN